jgi:hypothetical protein
LQDFNAFNQHIHFNISIHQQLGNYPQATLNS